MVPLDSRRPCLTKGDLLALNWLQGFLRGDKLSCLAVSREWSKSYPRQSMFIYEWGLDALIGEAERLVPLERRKELRW